MVTLLIDKKVLDHRTGKTVASVNFFPKERDVCDHLSLY